MDQAADAAMRLFHQHRWHDVGRIYMPPAAEFKLERGSPELVRELIWGVTVIEMVCLECGERHWHRIVGRHMEVPS